MPSTKPYHPILDLKTPSVEANMKQRLREWIEQLFPPPISPLPPGVYHWQSPPDAPQPHRMHLRIEPNGEGILILDASTVLHLNQTATEFAYHHIKGIPLDEVVREISKRYRVPKSQVITDFKDFFRAPRNASQYARLRSRDLSGHRASSALPRTIKRPLAFRLCPNVSHRG